MRYQFIGKGYWYSVFDIGNDRVRKVEKSVYQKIRDSYKQEGRDPFVWIQSLFKLLTKRQKISSQYKYIENNVDLSFLGSPKFLKGIDYEQDKTQTFGEMLNHANNVQAKELVDKYIESIRLSWEHGFADSVFNFTENSGVSKGGKVILLDFNEITLSKEDVLHSIKIKRWLKSWSASQINPELQSYYFEQMDRYITSEMVSKYWKSDC